MEPFEQRSLEDTGVFSFMQSLPGLEDGGMQIPSAERENFFHNFLVPLIDLLRPDDGPAINAQTGIRRRMFFRKDTT
jgi:hypothetical protein